MLSRKILGRLSMKKIYLSLLLVLVGCQSTTGDSRFNPEVTNVNVDKIAVLVPNDSRTESNIVDGIQKNGGKATNLTKVLEFIKEDSEIFNALKTNDVSHILIVSGRIGQESIRFAGSITNSNTNVNGWSTGQNIFATANTSTYSTPIYAASNYAKVNGKLYSLDGQLIWITDVELEAQGTVYTGAKAMSEGVANGLVKEMKKSGLLTSN